MKLDLVMDGPVDLSELVKPQKNSRSGGSLADFDPAANAGMLVV